MDTTTPESILIAMRRLAAEGRLRLSSNDIAVAAGTSLASAKRHIERLIEAGQVMRTGKARATRYELTRLSSDIKPVVDANSTSFQAWSTGSHALLALLNRPLATRDVVTYQRRFVDNYIPNETSLLPADIARELAQDGRMRGQQPAGTYARKVLEPLLIDLSWSSSRLEGNRFSLLATQELFKSGLSDGGTDAVMLLNHKRAIEFLVDAVPEYGLSTALVCNLHALLMQDLLTETQALGTIRQKVVNISDTTYVPTQIPAFLDEMFVSILDKARHIKNPIEAAFFLWINIAYLQPFEDGNKRTSRLAANIPLMLYNCAPLSFLDVDPNDYAKAMMGVYELVDVSMAVDLFVWTYARSIKKYVVVLESVGAPDPVRLHYRELLNDTILLIVRERKSIVEAFSILQLSEDNAPGFESLLVAELKILDVHNCARYRLTMSATQAWIADGRPG